MDVIEIVKALLRQIKLLIVLATLCLLVGGFAFFQIGSKYVATADLQVLPNSGANTENPLDKLSRNQATVAEMLAVRLSSGEVRNDIADEGLLSDYTVDSLSTSAGGSDLPSINIRVAGTKSGPVDETKEALVDRVNEELEGIQTEIGAPKETWLQAQVLTQTDEPFLESGSRVKSLLILVLLSGAFMVSTTLVVDGVRKSNEADRADAANPKKKKGETIVIPSKEEEAPAEKPRRSRIKK